MKPQTCADIAYTCSVVALVACYSAALASCAAYQSPTVDEPAHLAAGLAHWKFGRFDLYKVNPPLPRMLAALPALFDDVALNCSDQPSSQGGRPEFALGRSLIRDYGGLSQGIILKARWACIPFALLGLAACGCWAHRLYGRRASLGAMLLWCVEPTLFGHGQLITPDMAATAAGVTASYAFWQWLCTPTLVTTALAGTALAFALLTKLSWIILPVLWIFCWAIVRSQQTPYTRWIRDGALLITMNLIALYWVNAGYMFDGSCSRLDSFTFVSQSGKGDAIVAPHGNRFKGRLLGYVPVPLPRQYVLGCDLQRRDLEAYPYESYLLGEWRGNGWWYYYLLGLLVKLPSGLLMLFIAAMWKWFSRRLAALARIPSSAEFVLLVPAAALFLVASAHTSFSQHVRYVMPVIGPMVVMSSGILASTTRVARLLGLGAIAWTAGSSIMATPCHVGYFNEFAGGARGGPHLLLHSNVDWGQDLIHLEAWIAEHNDAVPLFLAYYGSYAPSTFGVAASTAPHGPWLGRGKRGSVFGPGWYAISVNYLHGCEVRMEERWAFSLLRYREPIAICGTSIWIYHVDASLALQMENELHRKTTSSGF